MSPKIHSRIWKDEDFWQLDAADKVAFLWLLTNGETNNCGHLVFSPRQFTSDTGLDPKGVLNLAKALPRAFVREGNHLWLRNFMRHQWSPGERGLNSKMFKGLINAIASMPETLRMECLREYPEFYAGVMAILAPAKPLASPLQAPSYPPSPLQGPYKAPEQSRAEQSRVFFFGRGTGGNRAGRDAAARIPGDARRRPGACRGGRGAAGGGGAGLERGHGAERAELARAADPQLGAPRPGRSSSLR